MEPESVVVASRFKDSDAVELTPFRHQVGGHFVIMDFDEHHLAKPVVPRELFFYQTAPKDVCTFIPRYHGVISLTVSQREDARTVYTARRKKKGAEGNVMENCSDMSRHGLRLVTRSLTADKTTRDEKDTSGITGTCGESGYMSPWTLKCEERLQDLLTEQKERDQKIEYDYIVLENAVSGFQHPCILDLKLGLQSHSDLMTEEKKQQHIQRCASTTTASLGFRFSGMQMYNSERCEFMFKDKYYGRGLSEADMADEMKGFFSAGGRLRVNAIQALLPKLDRLQAALQLQDSLRLFSVSLLLIYEGGQLRPGAVNGASEGIDRSTHVELRMIDFANATHKGYPEDPLRYEGPDEGWLFGLGNVIRILKELVHQSSAKE